MREKTCQLKEISFQRRGEDNTKKKKTNEREEEMNVSSFREITNRANILMEGLKK